MDSPKLSEIQSKNVDDKCSCDESEKYKSVDFLSVESPQLKEKRNVLYENYKKQNWNKYVEKPTYHCNPKSPINYPISEFIVEPRSENVIPGISIEPEIHGNVQLSISANHGIVTAVLGGKLANVAEYSATVSLRVLKYVYTVPDALTLPVLRLRFLRNFRLLTDSQ